MRKNTRSKLEARKYWHTRISMRDKNTEQEQEVSRTLWSYHDSESRKMDKTGRKSNSKQVRMDQASIANCAFAYQWHVAETTTKDIFYNIFHWEFETRIPPNPTTNPTKTIQHPKPKKKTKTQTRNTMCEYACKRMKPSPFETDQVKLVKISLFFRTTKSKWTMSKDRTPIKDLRSLWWWNQHFAADHSLKPRTDTGKCISAKTPWMRTKSTWTGEDYEQGTNACCWPSGGCTTLRTILMDSTTTGGISPATLGSL
jgi:hypothetical protein